MCDFADMDLLVGSLNVRSLVECSGDVRICRSRPVMWWLVKMLTIS